MAKRSGIAAQLGFKAESSWGTGVTVDRFLPFKKESLTANKARLDSDSIYAGRLVRDTEQWDEGEIVAGGDIELDVYTKGMGLLLKHAMGAVNTTGSGPYVHAFTPDVLDGLGLTLQVGKPDRASPMPGGTDHAFSQIPVDPEDPALEPFPRPGRRIGGGTRRRRNGHRHQDGRSDQARSGNLHDSRLDNRPEVQTASSVESCL